MMTMRPSRISSIASSTLLNPKIHLCAEKVLLYPLSGLESYKSAGVPPAFAHSRPLFERKPRLPGHRE
jgi:hypothetical protein